MWLADQANPDGSQAMVIWAVRIAGALDGAAAIKAIRMLGARHPALCMMIDDHSGTPEPRFAKPEDIPIAVEVCPAAEDPEAWTARRLRAAAGMRIDLRRAPALALRILVVSPVDYILCSCAHHISIDETSRGIIGSDFCRFYTAILSGDPIETEAEVPPEPSLRFDEPERLAGQRDLRLPWPGRSLKRQTERGASTLSLVHYHDLDHETSEALKAIAHRHRTTVFGLCAAAYRVVLARYCRMDEVGVGVAFSLRKSGGVQNTVGSYISAVGISPPMDHATNIGRQARAFTAELHAVRKGEKLTENPAFSASIVRYLAAQPVLQMPGLVARHMRLAVRSVLVELATSLREEEGSLELRMVGREALFTIAELEALMAAFVGLLREMVKDPQLMSSVSLPLDAQVRQQMAQRAITPAPVSTDLDLAEIFAAVAAATPQIDALCDGSGKMSYAELQSSARSLAGWLADVHGLGPTDRVGLMLERGNALAVAHLAVLLGGMVIVPIDRHYPDDRLDQILRQAGCALILCSDADGQVRVQSRTDGLNLATRVGLLPQLADGLPTSGLPLIDSQVPAYVMYTSGSTGTPKGVVVPRRALVRLAAGCFLQAIGPGDRVGQLASPSFDALFIELWGALLNGASLVFPDRALRQIEDFTRVLRGQQITHGFLTPSVFNLIAEEDLGALESMRVLTVGGEAMSAHHAALVKRQYPELVLANVYGPTENGALSTIHVLPGPPEDGDISVPIGRPLPGNMAFVLDHNAAPVPDGFFGELWLGGAGLALGYDGNPEQTAERFVSFDPVPLGLEAGPKMILYRTGDKVRWDPTGGVLEFHGRLDTQIKFNGFRIETAEIEAIILRMPGVRQAAVVTPRDGPGGSASAIVAVFDTTSSAVDLADLEASLRAVLAASLPRFCLPHRYVNLPNGLPLTASGKIDRRMLEDVCGAADVPTQQAVQKIDAGLVRIWTDLLGAAPGDGAADFFASGGHSVLAMRLLARLRRELDMSVALTDFLKMPTIGNLERQLRDDRKVHLRRKQTGSDNLSLLLSGPKDQAPLFCLPGIFGEAAWANKALPFLSDLGRPILGLRTPQDASGATVDQIAEDHAGEIAAWHRAHGLTEGPILIGYSIGGFLAVAVTAALERMGMPPRKLILLDPGSHMFPNPNIVGFAPDDDPSNVATKLAKHHRLRPIAARMDYVFTTKSFPWPKYETGADWAMLAQGGIDFYAFDSHHLGMALAPKAPDLAAVIKAVIDGTRRRDGHSHSPWSEEDMAKILASAQWAHAEDFGAALDVLSELPKARLAEPLVRLQQLRLWKRTKAQEAIIAEAESALAAPGGVSETWAMRLLGALDDVKANDLADAIDGRILALHPYPTAAIVFQRVRRHLSQNRPGRAVAAAESLPAIPDDPVAAGLVRLMVEPLEKGAGANGWQDRLLAILQHRDADPSHFSEAAAFFLQRGDDAVTARLLDAAKSQFPGNPIVAVLEDGWANRKEIGPASSGQRERHTA